MTLYLLSFFQNFLSKVVYITLYYDRWLNAMTVNDVNVMSFYGGKLLDLILNFNQINMDELNDPDLNWENGYKDYIPPNMQKYDNYSAPNPYDLYGGIVVNPLFQLEGTKRQSNPTVQSHHQADQNQSESFDSKVELKASEQANEAASSGRSHPSVGIHLEYL